MRTINRLVEGAGRRRPGRVGGLAAAGAVAFLLLAGVVGAAPGPLAWSGSFDFGTIAPGSTTSQQYTLTNTDGKGSGAITTSLSGSSAFAITSDGCNGVSLGKGKSCPVTVQYAPANAGQNDGATLTASSKKLGGASLNLTGASTVCAGNPTAVLTPAQGDISFTTVFSGLLSTDPCGRQLDYVWDCNAYSYWECDAANVDPSSATFTFTATVPGEVVTLGLIVCVHEANPADETNCSAEAGPYVYNAVIPEIEA
jgi:hypothetical protein